MDSMKHICSCTDEGTVFHYELVVHTHTHHRIHDTETYTQIRIQYIQID